MPHTPCRFQMNNVHSLQCLKDTRVLLSILRRQQKKSNKNSWMIKPEFGHFVFNPDRKELWSLKYSPLTPGCYELKKKSQSNKSKAFKFILTLYISSSKRLAPALPRSSGTEGGSDDPLGLDDTSAVRKTPSVVSATSVIPKPGDLHSKQQLLHTKQCDGRQNFSV